MENLDEFEKNHETDINTEAKQINEDEVIILGNPQKEESYSYQNDIPPNNGTNKKNPKTGKFRPFVRRQRNALLIICCVLLSVGGGFGGTILALHLTGSTGKTVLYQSVNNEKTSNKTDATNTSVKTIANETMKSVVEIKTESVSTNNYFQQAVVSGAGSGVILSEDGYIVTNNHVIEGANKISVTTKDGTTYEAVLIGTDSTTDLAVIKIEANKLTPVIMGDSSKLEVGDIAVAIGNPLGSLGGTVTSGIISALDREVTIDNQKMHLLQTSAAINPGNSGGGLFNDKGELIGVVNAKSSGESIEGLGFAIPINRAKDIITNLIENGYVKGRASLGVTLQVGSSNPFSNDESTQVYIMKVEEGKAAYKAGLEAGDQILKIDSTSIHDISDVTSAISTHSAGDKIEMTILRDNETKKIDVTLGEAATKMPTQNNNNE